MTDFFLSCPVGAAYGKKQAAPAFDAVDAGRVQYIPVAGTAGKTAVVAMTAAALEKAGLAVGRYTLGCLPLGERIRVNGAPVAPALLTAAAQKLAALPAVPALPVAELAAAADCFAAAGCQWAVVELGDAMLAQFLPQVPAAAITRMGDDGSGFGIEKRAHAACALMRRGCTVVTVPDQDKKALGEMVVCAAKAECELKVPDAADLEVGGDKLRTVDYGGYVFMLPHLGPESGQNAAVAVELALTLWRKLDLDIPDEAILEGVPLVDADCGVHFLRQRPRILAAPCHLPVQAEALARFLAAGKARQVSLIAGLTNCMDPDAFFAALETGFIPEEDADEKTRMAGMSDNPVGMVYCVAPAGEDALTADETEQAARFHFETTVCDSLADALAAARADESTLIVVLGGEAICRAAAKLLR